MPTLIEPGFKSSDLFSLPILPSYESNPEVIQKNSDEKFVT